VAGLGARVARGLWLLSHVCVPKAGRAR
jgi:hypothetical protein